MLIGYILGMPNIIDETSIMWMWDGPKPIFTKVSNDDVCDVISVWLAPNRKIVLLNALRR